MGKYQQLIKFTLMRDNGHAIMSSIIKFGNKYPK